MRESVDSLRLLLVLKGAQLFVRDCIILCVCMRLENNKFVNLSELPWGTNRTLSFAHNDSSIGLRARLFTACLIHAFLKLQADTMTRVSTEKDKKRTTLSAVRVLRRGTSCKQALKTRRPQRWSQQRNATDCTCVSLSYKAAPQVCP